MYKNFKISLSQEVLESGTAFFGLTSCRTGASHLITSHGPGGLLVSPGLSVHPYWSMPAFSCPRPSPTHWEPDRHRLLPLQPHSLTERPPPRRSAPTMLPRVTGPSSSHFNRKHVGRKMRGVGSGAPSSQGPSHWVDFRAAAGRPRLAADAGLGRGHWKDARTCRPLRGCAGRQLSTMGFSASPSPLKLS